MGGIPRHPFVCMFEGGIVGDRGQVRWRRTKAGGVGVEQNTNFNYFSKFTQFLQHIKCD